MIENTSSMDRPVAAQRNPRLLAAAAAAHGGRMRLQAREACGTAVTCWLRADG